MRRYLLLLLLPVLSLAQTTTENYIISTNYKVPTLNPAVVSAEDKEEQITYFDGLGRPIQIIAHRQSGTGQDIVTPIVYDMLGRQPIEYLPVPLQSASLNFYQNQDVINDSYYSDKYGADGNYPFSEKSFEESALGRVLEQGAPGEDWRMIGGSNADHTIKLGYLTNENLTIRRLEAIATWNPAKGLYDTAFLNPEMYMLYSGNELYISITKDENWTSGLLNTTEEYKNKQGQVVLKRAYNLVGTTVTEHDTYYVYDQFGNISYVLPPMASGNIITKLDNLCYQYKYDDRNRLVEKKLPGKQWEFMLYDKLNRVVATGPANAPFSNTAGVGWLITKYDSFNRAVLTGWLPSSTVTAAGRTSLQSTLNGLTILNEARTTGNTTINNIPFRYSTLAWPTSGYHVMTTNYYDDYNYPGAPASFSVILDTEQIFYNNSTQKPKGMPTGSWVRVLTTMSSTAGETSYTLYDKKARPVRNHTTNHLSGYTYRDSKFKFNGETEYVITCHKRDNLATEIKTKESFTYSNQDRLLTHTHQITFDGTAGPVERLNDKAYDRLGQLESKRVGGPVSGTGLQKVDYRYNIRGWLKDINNIENLAEGGNIPSDLFALGLNYNKVDYSVSNQVEPLYNGNISESYWLTNSDNALRKYGFIYDDLNRLTEAIYQKPLLGNQSSAQVTNSYNEEIGYDMHGNIIYLNRNGYIDADAANTYPIDNLVYNYDTGTNVLRRVDDESNSLDGFRDGLNPREDYYYDANGNMTGDLNKGINEGGISYNHLNLPTRIQFQVEQGEKFIEYIYNAFGVKVGKRVLHQGPGTNVHEFTDYLDGYQYLAGALQFFPTTEGYVSVTGDRFNYVYNYTDQLGNTRLSYTDDGGTLKTLEESHYYPFGMRHNYNREIRQWGGNLETGIFAILMDVERNKYQYKFQGQERQDELSLNWDSFKWRNYDFATGRFMSIDPLAPDFPQWSPYVFSGNLVTVSKELEGMEPEFLIQSNGKLTSGVVSLMHAAYGYSVSSLQNSTWIINSDARVKMWDKITDHPEASVKGNQVVYSKNAVNEKANYWFGLISHEQSHRDDVDSGVSNIDRKGYTKFYLRYLLEGSVRDYEDISTEDKAFKFGSNDNGPDLADKLLAYKGGAVMSIFQRGNLTDNEKANMLDVVGNQFKRDVVLQGNIDGAKSGLSEIKDSKWDSQTKASATNLLNTLIKMWARQQKEITKKYGE